MTHPARNPKTERWLDSLGAAWTFDADVPLAKIDRAASLANQVRHQALDQESVERYAADMRQGDDFPAILIDGDGAILGGNHRYVARGGAGQATIAAYRITADAGTLLRIRVEDNRNHGLPTTKAERLDHGAALVASGMSNADAARIVGIAGAELTTHIGCVNFAARITEHDQAETAAKLAKGVRYSLSQITDDAVLDAAVDLVVEAALPIDVVRALVDTTRSVDFVEAMRVIGQMTDDFSDRIADRAGNLRKASLSERAKLDNALAVILGLKPQAIHDACPNDDVRAVLAQRILNAAGVLAPTAELLMGKRPVR